MHLPWGIMGTASTTRIGFGWWCRIGPGRVPDVFLDIPPRLGIYQSAEFNIPGGMELCRPKPDTGVSADSFPGQKDLLAHLFLLVRWWPGHAGYRFWPPESWPFRCLGGFASHSPELTRSRYLLWWYCMTVFQALPRSQPAWTTPSGDTQRTWWVEEFVVPSRLAFNLESKNIDLVLELLMLYIEIEMLIALQWDPLP